MNKMKLKEYHRPFMIAEQFFPNESVTSCVKNTASWVHGLFCVDLNNNGHFDPYEDRNTGSDYVGSYYLSKINDGKFEILQSGRYYEGAGPGYLYVGSGSFKVSINDQDDLNSAYFSYTLGDFVPLYYANVGFSPIGDPSEIKIYFTDDNAGNVFTNAS